MKTMKKIISILITAAILFCLFSSCGRQKGKIIFPEDELLAGYRSEKDLEMEMIRDAGRIKAVHFHRGDTEVYGEIYLPEGDGPFPVIVISGGFATSHYAYQGMASMYSENGIIGVVYDPSDMGDMGADPYDFIEWSVLKEAADIESIISALSKLPYVDDDNIFLWGHSMGGFASAYVGFRNPDLIKGMILVEPAFYLNEDAKEQFPDIDKIPEIVPGDRIFGRSFYKDLCSFDIYEYMPDYDRNILLFAGTLSPSIGADMPELIERAEKSLPSCKTIYQKGADHYFNGMPMLFVIDYSIDFVEDNMQ